MNVFSEGKALIKFINLKFHNSRSKIYISIPF